MPKTFKNFKIFKKTGFTLIELLISIFIIVTLTSLFLANFRGQTRQRAVNSATNNLISDLHKIQSFSLSSRDVTPGNPASQYATTIANNGTNYSLLGYNNAVPPTATTVGTTLFPTGVIINSIAITKADGTVVNPTSVTLGFKIPFGKVIVNYTGSATNEVNDVARIKLSSSDGVVCSYVVVNGITGNVTSLTPCP